MAVEPGHTLLIDDGKVRLTVTEAESNRMVTRVEVGGRLADRKGVSLPHTTIPTSALTDKDLSDLEAALNAGIDWVALSFIQRPEDIAEAKKLTRGRAAVMAKIEKPQAVARLDEIMDQADALMVARGDLGVEMPLEKVPGVQKQMTRLGRATGKPVVVATQMLESMINSPVPTRAEVSDVATAIFEGADAVMLSAESAAGKYPIEAVATMNRIAEEVESEAVYRGIISAQRATPEATGADAIADAARHIADTLDLAALVCWTASGSTALRVARERPRPPIVAVSPNIRTGRKLAVVWGVHCVVTEDARDQDDMVDRACRIAFKEGFARGGQRIITVAGVPFGTPGRDQYAADCVCGAGGGGSVSARRAVSAGPLSLQRCRNVGDRAKQDERVVFCGDEAASFPERGGLAIDGFDDQCTAADEAGCGDASLQGMLEQSGTDTFSGPLAIRRKLSQQQTGDGIGRLSGADRARQRRGQRPPSAPGRNSRPPGWPRARP